MCGALSLLRPYPCIHSAVKGLGEESDSEESTSEWVQKLKQRQREKEIAEKKVETSDCVVIRTYISLQEFTQLASRIHSQAL